MDFFEDDSLDLIEYQATEQVNTIYFGIICIIYVIMFYIEYSINN
jgi:hypothetical protein